MIDGDQSVVIGERLLAGGRVAGAGGDLLGFLFISGGERVNLIEVLALVLRPKLKPKRERLIVTTGNHLLALYFLTALIGDDRDDGFARKSDRC